MAGTKVKVKVTQGEVDRQSPTGLIFLFFCWYFCPEKRHLYLVWTLVEFSSDAVRMPNQLYTIHAVMISLTSCQVAVQAEP